MTTTYNISTEVLELALTYMKSEGYMGESDTTDDLISFTRSMVQDIDDMVVYKLNEWASELV